MPEDRKETEESILSNINEWFIYANEDHNEPSVDERITALEDLILLLMEG